MKLLSFNQKTVSVFFLLASLLPLLVAVILEHLFDFTPCQLCIYERWPYFIAFLFSLLMLVRGDLVSIFAVFLLPIFAIGALISIYHIGIEYKIFTMTKACKASLEKIDDLESLYADINLAKVASCDVAQKIFGIPLSHLNLFYSIFIIIVGYFFLKKHGKESSKKSNN